MTDTIKSVTKCITCGGECEVKGDTTHYYVPKKHRISTENSKQLFATILAKNIGTDEDPNLAIEMIGKDTEVTALYNTCLEFSATCNELAESKVKELTKEKDEALRLLNDALKLLHSLPDLLHDSLGETIEGNEYTIAPYDPLGGDFWITHNKVGSGEPLKQWIKSEIDKALDKNIQ